MSTLLEQSRCVCLGKSHREECRDAGEDHVNPEDPSTTDGLADEATDNGAKDWSAVRGCGEKRDGKTALVVVPDVGDGTTREGEGCGGEETAEETAYKERLDVLGNGARDVEDDVAETGEDPDRSAAEEFTLKEELVTLADPVFESDSNVPMATMPVGRYRNRRP